MTTKRYWISAAGLPVNEPEPDVLGECKMCAHVFLLDEMDEGYCKACARLIDGEE